jgi:Domain of unknown function (DUF4157)
VTLEQTKKPSHVTLEPSKAKPEAQNQTGKSTFVPMTAGQLQRARAKFDQSTAALQGNQTQTPAFIPEHPGVIAEQNLLHQSVVQAPNNHQANLHSSFIKSPMQRRALERMKTQSMETSSVRDQYQMAIMPEMVQRLVGQQTNHHAEETRASQSPNALNTRTDWFNTELPVLRAQHNNLDKPDSDNASVFTQSDARARDLGRTYVAQRVSSGLTANDAATAIINIQRSRDRNNALKGMLSAIRPQDSDYSRIQRLVAEKEHQLEVQRQATQEALMPRALQLAKEEAHPSEANSGISQRIQAKLGGGSPLPEHVRSQLETGLNTNLEGVRVHTDGEADKLAKSVNALAFTTGKDIFFSSGKFEPNTKTGYELLAHETTHTVQQASGQVKPGVDSDLSLETDAQAKGAELAAKFDPNAKAVASKSDQSQSTLEMGSAGSGVVVQRQRDVSIGRDSRSNIENTPKVPSAEKTLTPTSGPAEVKPEEVKAVQAPQVIHQEVVHQEPTHHEPVHHESTSQLETVDHASSHTDTLEHHEVQETSTVETHDSSHHTEEVTDHDAGVALVPDMPAPSAAPAIQRKANPQGEAKEDEVTEAQARAATERVIASIEGAARAGVGRVKASSEGGKAQVKASVQSQHNALNASHAVQNAALNAASNQAGAQIAQAGTSTAAQIQASGNTSVAAVTNSVNTHTTRASTVVNQHATTVNTTATASAGNASSAASSAASTASSQVNASAEAVRGKGNSAPGGSEPEVGEMKANASRKYADEGAQKISSESSKLTGGLTSSGTKVASDIRQKGSAVASDIRSVLPGLQGQIRQTGEAGKQSIIQTSTKASQGVIQAATQARTQLKSAAAQATQQLGQAKNQQTQQLQSAGSKATAQIEGKTAGTVAKTEAGIAAMRANLGRTLIDPKQAEALQNQITSKISAASSQLASGTRASTSSVASGISKGGALAVSTMNQVAPKASAKFSGVSATTVTSLQSTTAKVTPGFTSIATGVRTAGEGMVTKADTGLRTKASEVSSKFKQSETTFKTDLTTTTTTELEKTKSVEGKVDSTISSAHGQINSRVASEKSKLESQANSKDGQARAEQTQTATTQRVPIQRLWGWLDDIVGWFTKQWSATLAFLKENWVSVIVGIALGIAAIFLAPIAIGALVAAGVGALLATVVVGAAAGIIIAGASTYGGVVHKHFKEGQDGLGAFGVSWSEAGQIAKAAAIGGVLGGGLALVGPIVGGVVGVGGGQIIGVAEHGWDWSHWDDNLLFNVLQTAAFVGAGKYAQSRGGARVANANEPLPINETQPVPVSETQPAPRAANASEPVAAPKGGTPEPLATPKSEPATPTKNEPVATKPAEVSEARPTAKPEAPEVAPTPKKPGLVKRAANAVKNEILEIPKNIKQVTSEVRELPQSMSNAKANNARVNALKENYPRELQDPALAEQYKNVQETLDPKVKQQKAEALEQQLQQTKQARESVENLQREHEKLIENNPQLKAEFDQLQKITDPKVKQQKAEALETNIKLVKGEETVDVYTKGKLPPQGPARNKFLDDPNNWTPERQALHNELIQKAKADAQVFADMAQAGDPTVYAMRGNTAAGKSRAIKGNIPELENPVTTTENLRHRAVNPDNFKLDLMEAESRTPLTSDQTHQESSMLARRLENELKQLKTSDGTETGSILIDKRLATLQDVENYAKMAQETGRKLNVYDVDADLEVSLAGVLGRKPGGDSPLPKYDVVGQGFTLVRTSRIGVIEIFENNPNLGKYELYGTLPDGSKIKVAEVSNGKRAIFNEELFNEITSPPGPKAQLTAKDVITSAVIDSLASSPPLTPKRAQEVRHSLEPFLNMTWEEALKIHSQAKK